MRRILEQMHFEDSLAVIKLTKQLIKNYKPNSLIINIGSASIMYDSVGPLVGSMLETRGGLVYDIAGTLDEPIDFANLKEKMSAIHEMYPGYFIIGVDAAVSSRTGNISFCSGPVYPGARIGKKAAPVGDISILAGMGMNYSFHAVYGCAKTISTAIIEADRYIRKYNFLH